VNGVDEYNMDEETIEAGLNDVYKDLKDEGHISDIQETIQDIMDRFQNTNKLMPDGYHVNFIVK
jgi:hypothetical protein